jgi:hypothetical protein
METTTQVTTARNAHALAECLLPAEAKRVEFKDLNAEQTEVLFRMTALKAFVLVDKVMARVAKDRGKRGYPHQSMHHLRTRLWWQLTDEDKRLHRERENSAKTKGRTRRS